MADVYHFKFKMLFTPGDYKGRFLKLYLTSRRCHTSRRRWQVTHHHYYDVPQVAPKEKSRLIFRFFLKPDWWTGQNRQMKTHLEILSPKKKKRDECLVCLKKQAFSVFRGPSQRILLSSCRFDLSTMDVQWWHYTKPSRTSTTHPRGRQVHLVSDGRKTHTDDNINGIAIFN